VKLGQRRYEFAWNVVKGEEHGLLVLGVRVFGNRMWLWAGGDVLPVGLMTVIDEMVHGETAIDGGFD
jgi:hypothetical protein